MSSRITLLALLLATLPAASRAAETAAGSDPLESIIGSAEAEGLPTALLEAKRREARLKRVPAERARPVLEGLVGRLREADALVPGERGPSERAQAVSAAALALSSGAEPKSLGEALRASTDARGRELAAQAVTSLLQADVDPRAAAKLVGTAMKNGLSDRVLTVRAALEQLRGSGYAEEELIGELQRTLEAGRPPLEAVQRARRGADRERGHGQGNGNGGPDRDRAEKVRGGPDRDKPDRGGGKP